MVVIIDYKVGNLKSVYMALKRIGIEAVITSDANLIRSAKAIILPGVGTFQVAMKKLDELNLIDVIKDAKNKGIPILGICLGMQILFEQGSEIATTSGLEFLKGTVDKIITTEKLPHMGWNELYINKKHPITKYISDGDDVYFVHSYKAYAIDDEIIAYAKYGDQIVPAIVASNNVVGCQFHPEKSGEIGKQILLAFKEMIL